MLKKGLIIFALFFSVFAIAQNIKISGNINDTTGKQKLPNAVLMAIKFTDSTLVNFTRTDQDGLFKPFKVPIDTYIVIISHPSFNDRTYLLVPNKNDSVFNFKNVILPPKSVDLNEVEIIAFKDKMYYKGDTLQFTADSFKTRDNATVEDLLRKLPGIKVDAAGKITIQGKQVDQVLVDGDEFFGSDPTIATKNLNANTVETIQVFEKKNENSDGDGEETVKIVNLKLKEDAKKGYFGKISGASDFQKFYENDVLLNKFKKEQKISLFGLFANTPKQAFGWQDADRYGINDNGNTSYDPETNSWTSFDDGSSGIPQTLKSGFYYNDKLGKKTKINSDYTFNQNQLVTGSEINTQFFLQDTTYSNKQTLGKTTNNQSHNFNLRLTTKLDSLTELVIKPKINYQSSDYSNYQNDAFITEEGEDTRSTNVNNKGKSETIDAGLQMKMNKSFAKKDRLLTITYNPSYYNMESKNDLNTDFKYFKNQLPDSSLLQKRTQLNHRQEQNAGIVYFEPITKKIKTEISYNFAHNLNSNNRKTLDFNGSAYDLINTSQSNDFRNTRVAHRMGGKIIYDVKKYRLSLGSNFRTVYQENINVTTKQTLTRNFNNLMPFANINYRFSQSSNLYVNYNASAQQPDLQQLQPVVDNSDPNRIKIGNPDLKPQFTNNVNLNYYFYKGISDVNFYGGGYFSHNTNEITEKTNYDSLGRSIITPFNVSGNYNGNGYIGGGFPVFKRLFKVNYSLNSSFSQNISYVNDLKNTTQTYGVYPGLNLEKEFEWMQLNVGGSYNYDVTEQTISNSSNQNYFSYSLTGNLFLILPANFKISVDANYTNNGNRTPGYNIEYTILNASISKSFFKTENLIVSVDGNDILNQNISNRRSVETNRIIDTKTQIIKRYFLLRLIYKFNSQKGKTEEEEYD